MAGAFTLPGIEGNEDTPTEEGLLMGVLDPNEAGVVLRARPKIPIELGDARLKEVDWPCDPML